MNQSGALRRLETVLEYAVENGQKNRLCGHVLLEAMNLSIEAHNLINFYELLNKAYTEAELLKGIPEDKLGRNLKVLTQLKEQFIAGQPWNNPWEPFCRKLIESNTLAILPLLANESYRINPKVDLELDFLRQLYDEFNSLLEQINESSLSQKIKQLLIIQIESILQSIRRYDLEGTQGIEQIAKLAILDLTTGINKITKEDKRHPLVKRVLGSLATLSQISTPITTAALLVITVTPDLDQYWMRKIQDFLNTREKVEEVIDEESTVEIILEKASEISQTQKMKAMSGKDFLLLPPSKEEIENDVDNVEGNTNF
jgi:hypothetical protein